MAYQLWYTMPAWISRQCRSWMSAYATSTGSEPVRKWLRSLSHESRKMIGDDIKTVQFGWPLGMPLVRSMEPGLWEVRIHLPSDIARVLFTTADSQMVLLHGFIKKTQKHPGKTLRWLANA